MTRRRRNATIARPTVKPTEVSQTNTSSVNGLFLEEKVLSMVIPSGTSHGYADEGSQRSCLHKRWPERGQAPQGKAPDTASRDAAPREVRPQCWPQAFACPKRY